MSGPVTSTRWTCDHCGATAAIAGSHAGDPDVHGWTRIDLSTAFGSTGVWGIGSRVYQDAEPRQRTRLVCSVTCALAVIADRWKFMWGNG